MSSALKGSCFICIIWQVFYKSFNIWENNSPQKYWKGTKTTDMSSKITCLHVPLTECLFCTHWLSDACLNVLEIVWRSLHNYLPLVSQVLHSLTHQFDAVSAGLTANRSLSLWKWWKILPYKGNTTLCHACQPRSAFCFSCCEKVCRMWMFEASVCVCECAAKQKMSFTAFSINC